MKKNVSLNSVNRMFILNDIITVKFGTDLLKTMLQNEPNKFAF